MEDLFVRIFCEDICWVVRTQDLVEKSELRVKLFLNPQVGDVKMSNTAHASTASDANGGCRVCMYVYTP